jgi:hypothetical protein
MHPQIAIGGFIVVSLIGGILGGLAMEAVLRLISRAEWARCDMIVALGSLLTKSRENAFRTGAIVHLVSAVVFAFLYCFAIVKFGLAYFPAAFFAGLGIGLIHGFIVSLALGWVVAEQHPLEEFREASLAVCVAHLAAHAAYGAVVGLTIALSGVL